jgi:hypothetical protein
MRLTREEGRAQGLAEYKRTVGLVEARLALLVAMDARGIDRARLSPTEWARVTILRS